VLGIRAEHEGCDQLRTGADQTPCADIPVQGHDLTPQVSAKHHRGLEEATHAERRGRSEGDLVNLEKAIEKARADSELIPHDDHGAFDVGTKSGKPGPQ
jgi:hypothetical protein